MPREPSKWPEYPVPILMPMTGFRDQSTRITYLPWTDAIHGLVGWEVLPDKRPNQNILVYIVPTIDRGTFEIRCHITTEEPNPDDDELLGKITLPSSLFEP